MSPQRRRCSGGRVRLLLGRARQGGRETLAGGELKRGNGESIRGSTKSSAHPPPPDSSLASFAASRQRAQLLRHLSASQVGGCRAGKLPPETLQIYSLRSFVFFLSCFWPLSSRFARAISRTYGEATSRRREANELQLQLSGATGERRRKCSLGAT